MFNSKIHSPCKDCELRVVEPTCHDSSRCCKWAKYEKEKEEYNKALYERNKQKEIENYRAKKITMINLRSKK